ncbi:hypothetical protein FH972_022834 [Carpinus fangiana]|uniref:Zn(2)-C6 fungal-type domain-containing protein n=1 Tax=Carpinus fangiana TaxID=176857 RepID=A0A5N6KTW9_9ROSI|nr:hypothetical protein FH972_022834 [Carpinus fangiana]
MPPIKIQTEAPINNTTVPTSTTRATDRPSSTTSAYPPARPGAVAGPAPTAAPVAVHAPPPTQTLPVDSTLPLDGPPQPQPGAVPNPPSIFTGNNTPAHLPPPPQPGQTPRTAPPPPAGSAYAPAAPISSTPQTMPLPAQLSYAPPGQNAAPTHSTVASHPPGYQQNPHLGDVTHTPTSPQDKQDSGNVLEGVKGWIAGNNSSGHAAGPLGLGTGQGGLGLGGEVQGVSEIWEGTKKFIGDAAKKLMVTMADGVRKTSSTPPHGQLGSKRRRRILSCLECKRRKLKCDRQLPACTRCRTVGRSAQCSYDPRYTRLQESDGESDASLDPANDSLSKEHKSSGVYGADAQRLSLPRPLQSQKREAEPLFACFPVEYQRSFERPVIHRHSIAEEALGIYMPHGKDGDLRHDPALDGPEPVIFRGKSFRTQYWGASHPSGILSCFQGVHKFFKDVLEQEPTLASLSRDVRNRNLEKKRVVPETPPPIEILVPDKATCCNLMEMYFRCFGSLYSIVHQPSFWVDFRTYWAGKLQEPQRFVAVMLAAMSCSRCLTLDSPPQYEGNTSIGRLQANAWVDAVEHWHGRQSHKHTNLASFQVPCLLLMSKKTNSIKLKRHYVLAQTLFSTGLSAGFHREPSDLGARISPFDREMRRRIWATMVELELAAAVARGLPSMVSSVASQTRPPLNIRDADLELETCESRAQADSIFTESSFLRLSAKTRSLRGEISNLVNDHKRHVVQPYNNILSYQARLTTYLDSIPKWSGEADVGNVEKGMLELQLQEALFMLHLPFAVKGDSRTSAVHSRAVCFDAAREMLRIHSEGLHGGTVAPLYYPRSDVVRAGICFCLLKPSRATTRDVGLLELEKRLQAEQMLRVLDVMEARILRLGIGFKGYWMILASSCYVEADTQGPTSTSWRTTMIDRCAALHYKISSGQVTARVQQQASVVVSATAGAKDIDMVEATGAAPQTNDAAFDVAFDDLGLPPWVFDDVDLFSWTDV